MLSIKNIIFLFLLFSIFGYKTIQQAIVKKQDIQKSDIFRISEGINPVSFNNFLNDSLQGNEVVLKGKIYDTGAINLFYHYQYNEGNITAKRFFLDKRVYENKLSSQWIELRGHYSKTGKDKIEISVSNYIVIESISKHIEGAIKYTNKWFGANKKNFDLNKFKQTDRFQTALLDFQNTDLNQTVFEADSSILFVDFNKKLIGVNCGSHILRKTEQRSDFLSFFAIYCYSHNVIKEIIVQNTGYFLE